MTLRSKLIRLANEHPEFRGDLLPILKEAAISDAAHAAGDPLVKIEGAINSAENKMVSAIQKLDEKDQADAKDAIAKHIDSLIARLKKVKSVIKQAR